MLAVEVELLNGTYRADPTGDALTGEGTGEWPPAPSRLLAALIDAGGSQGREAPELAAFAKSGPPIIYADPAPSSQKLHNRYVVVNAREKRTHLEYLGRKGTLVRPGVRMSPRNRRIIFLYPDFSPEDKTLSALQYRAARVGYLGCSDSPVAMSIRSVARHPEGTAFIPDPEGSVSVNTHTEGQVAVWCAAFDAWQKERINRRRWPALRHQTAYRHPHDPEPSEEQGRVLVWFRFADTVSGRRVAEVAHAFKRAVYSRYQELHGEIPPAWFHGHGIAKSRGDWQLARFLPLPNAAHSYADGRIHGAALWLPPGIDDIEARRVGEAARAVTYLPRITAGLALSDRQDSRRATWTTKPGRWTKPSQQWVSVFPVVSDRHGPVRQLGAVDVARWCRQAGLPVPAAARVSRTPLVTGAVDLSQPETARPGHTQTRPWAHVELFFAEKVIGPVIIGAARSYGLGLCAPIDEKESIKVAVDEKNNGYPS